MSSCPSDLAAPGDLVYSGGLKLEEEREVEGGSRVTAGKLVLSPTRTYAPIVKKILADGLRDKVHGMVHCSGGAQTKALLKSGSLRGVASKRCTSEVSTPEANSVYYST